MKKTITFLLLLFVSAAAVFAAPVDPDKALATANSFWNSTSGSRNVLLRLENKDMSKSAGRHGVQVSVDQYYIFAPENGEGFVIVSGEDRLAPIVGYSTSDCTGEMPPVLVEWLAQYSDYVDDVRAGVVEPLNTIAAAGKKIEPMLKTSWNQSAPYNDLCPIINGQKTPTGCTATAMAQIMKFHEWPEKAKKDIVWNNNITGADESVKLTSHTYRWDQMLNHYRDGYTAVQGNAVAQLMVDVGKAINSSYALEGTGSSEIYVSNALVQVFNYSPELKIVRRTEHTEEEFVAIIRENLEARQPLLYTGMSQSYEVGHAFVCDGIDENNMLHIDWGWDGAYNGYFDMTSMAPGGTGIGGGADRYNVGQSLVANIRPRSSNEANGTGTPTVFMMDVVDAGVDLGTQTPETLFEQSVDFVGGVAGVRFAAAFLNWSHSNVALYMAVGVEKDGEVIGFERSPNVQIMKFGDSFGYYWDMAVSNNPSSEDYLATGTYRIRMYYTDMRGNRYLARGAENGLLLEVGDKVVKLSKELPEVKNSAVSFHKTPKAKGDKLIFNAKFRSTNGKSATVLIVPVIKRVLEDGTISSNILSLEAEVLQVYDDRDIEVSFLTNYTFSADGRYYLDFMYNLKNEFTDLEKFVDKVNLFEVGGNEIAIGIGSGFEVTGVAGVGESPFSVVAGDGCIVVGGAVAAKVLSTDGRTVYSGHAATVDVGSGMYMVVAEDAFGNVTVRKVIVK